MVISPLKQSQAKRTLGIEIPKPEIPEIALDSEETSYDPLNPNFKLGHQAEDQSSSESNNKSQITEKQINDINAWPIEERYISEKQVSFMKKLAKSTDTSLPKKKELLEMGLKFASEVIDYLLQKKRKMEAEESLTDRQAGFLRMLSNRHEIDMDGQDIYGLTKIQAKSIIGRYKQSLPTVHSWH